MFGLSTVLQTGVQSSAQGARRRRTASSRRPFFRPSIEGLEVRIALSTTTTLTSFTNPSVFGQTVTLTATVTADPDSPLPIGTVNFLDGTTKIDSRTLDGSANPVSTSVSTSNLAVGTHSITAEYVPAPGDTSNVGSTSPAVSQVVDPADTTTTLTSSTNPSVFGQTVTFTATVAAVPPVIPTVAAAAVAPGADPPTGAVDFLDGATLLGTGTLDPTGVATFSTSALDVAGSPHSITAVYTGDPNFLTSTSPAVPQVVDPADTTTTLISSTNPSVFGETVTFTAFVAAVPPVIHRVAAAVAPGADPPTGAVDFLDGATLLGTGTLDHTGVATFSTSALDVAGSPHSITAVYTGDPNFLASISNAVSQVVNQDSTATTLSSSQNPSVFGQQVTFTATVTANPPGSGIPTGTVTFEDGTTSLGTGTLSGGVATFATAALSASGSPHSITAVYGGDTNFFGTFTTSPSNTVSQVVNQDSTATTLSSSQNPSVFGQQVTFTATVTANPHGSGIPTGTVTFMDGTTTLGTGTLNAVGVATLGTNALAVGTHLITADYAGDTNFATSASPVLSQVVVSPFVVTNTNDSGLGSLRFAIQAANADLNHDDTITFQIPTTDPRYHGATGSWTIPVGAGLTIAKPSSEGGQHVVVIDGLSQQSQPGSSITHPVIEITPAAGFVGDGLTLNSGGNTVQGLVIDGFQSDGLVLNSGTSNNLVVGNFVGTDPTGAVGRGNTLDGIRLLNNASSNRIINNVVSDNGFGQNGINQDAAGINLESNDHNNIIAGNKIGTNAAGDARLGNSLHGIFLGNGSSNNTIGDNVIFGNGKFPVANLSTQGGVAVYIFGVDTSGNVVQGNKIGTHAAGIAALDNSVIGVLINQSRGNTVQGNVISGNRHIGIEIAGGTASGNLVQDNSIGTNGSDGIFINDAPNNTIGGTPAGAGNRVSGNGFVGIQLFGQLTKNNVIQGNIISGNRLGGILVNTNANNTIGGTGPGQANEGQNIPIRLPGLADPGSTSPVAARRRSRRGKAAPIRTRAVVPSHHPSGLAAHILRHWSPSGAKKRSPHRA
jgi:parallel beta-helix repeat protein